MLESNKTIKDKNHSHYYNVTFIARSAYKSPISTLNLDYLTGKQDGVKRENRGGNS